jgi:hypothetical protein
VRLRRQRVRRGVSAQAHDAAGSSGRERLAQHYPAFGPDRADEIGGLLDNEEYWREQEASAAPLADKYFADFRGSSAQRAAEILSNIDALLAKPTHGDIHA